MNSILTIIFIFFRALSLFIFGGLMLAGVDTATRDGKKIANEISDYLSNAGYNVSIDSGDNRASLKIDLSNNKYLKEEK